RPAVPLRRHLGVRCRRVLHHRSALGAASHRRAAGGRQRAAADGTGHHLPRAARLPGVAGRGAALRVAMNFARTYEWLIGTRYLRSGHRLGFLSFITAISVVGLMLGVAVLVVVMSVMNGFEQELRSRILSVTSHATLMGLEQRLPDWQRAQERALSMPGVREAAPYIESPAMFAAPERNVITGAELRGIDPAQEARLGGLSRVVTQGSLDGLLAGGYRILLGSALASELGVTVGDSVVVIVPEVSVTPVGVEPRRRRFEVAGLFESGMYEYDRGLALVHVAD